MAEKIQFWLKPQVPSASSGQALRLRNASLRVTSLLIAARQSSIGGA